MIIDEYVKDRSNEGGKNKTDIERIENLLNEQQEQLDDLSNAFEDFVLNIYPAEVQND